MKNFILRFIAVFLVLLLFSTSASFGQLNNITTNEETRDKEIKKDHDSWIGMDKFLHFAASAGITGLSYHCYHCQYNNPKKNSIYFSISIAGATGIGKEIYDHRFKKTGWSWKDIVVDAAGVAVGYLLFIKLSKK